MKKIKEFFSPLKGGGPSRHEGLTFGKWFMHMQRAGLIVIFSVLMATLGLISPIEEWGSPGAFWGVEIFLGSILILIIFKTLQHWNDLRNKTSR